MTVRLGLISTLAACAALSLAGCGSNTPGTSTGVGGVPTAAATSGTGGHAIDCSAYPTFSVAASSQPSFPSDAALLAKFPAQVAGQPTSDLQAVPFFGLLCLVGGQAAVDKLAQSGSALGIDFSTVSFGSFDAQVDGSSATVNAIRTPGQDAGKLIANFGLFGAFAGLNLNGTGLSSGNVGGKNVQLTAADAGGTRTYIYVSGDTLFIIDGEPETTAAAILQALA
jgi:hypothetical protein